jgi:RNA polymerase sigma factor (sigma-70 family)
MIDEAGDGGRWARLLGRVVRRRGNATDSEDLLHSAWLRLEQYRRTNEVHDEDAFLVRTSLNLGIDGDRRARFQLAESVEVACAAVPDPTPLQDEVLAARIRLERVRDGLGHLSERTRRVFLMHRLEGRKYREIAAHFGISQSAVEKHIAKATLFLADWMEGH